MATSYKNVHEWTGGECAQTTPTQASPRGRCCSEMPNRLARTPIPKFLPLGECDGPRLGRFEHHNSRIHWLERLDDADDEDETSEGFVFRAKIEEKYYAVKVFKFYDPMIKAFYWRRYLGEDTSPHEAAWYCDPFYAECRAYGRLQDTMKARNGYNDIAVPCFGFTFLQPRDVAILRKRKINLGLQTADPEYQEDAVWACRPRAIIKKLASPDDGVNTSSLGKIRKNIGRLNRIKILNHDIRKDNFRDGKLVDFGSSWTEPHRVLNALPPFARSERMLVDRSTFDEMVEDEEIPNPKEVKALHSMRLRSHKN